MYIRTKDGRIIDTTKIATGSKYMNFATNDESFREIFKTEPLAKSENLEELCDEGVIEVKFGSTGYKAHFNKYIDELKNFLKYLKECQPITKDEILNVYGAIWTDKGLIYVAKMNDKGELVLI